MSDVFADVLATLTLNENIVFLRDTVVLTTDSGQIKILDLKSWSRNLYSTLLDPPTGPFLYCIYFRRQATCTAFTLHLSDHMRSCIFVGSEHGSGDHKLKSALSSARVASPTSHPESWPRGRALHPLNCDRSPFSTRQLTGKTNQMTTDG